MTITINIYDYENKTHVIGNTSKTETEIIQDSLNSDLKHFFLQVYPNITREGKLIQKRFRSLIDQFSYAESKEEVEFHVEVKEEFSGEPIILTFLLFEQVYKFIKRTNRICSFKVIDRDTMETMEYTYK